jgi:hypothetical protein
MAMAMAMAHGALQGDDFDVGCCLMAMATASDDALFD